MSIKKVYEKFAKANGYVKSPPTIDEFMTNPYYLGDETMKGSKIFPFWLEKMRQWFPTPFYEKDPDKKIILLTGST